MNIGKGLVRAFGCDRDRVDYMERNLIEKMDDRWCEGEGVGGEGKQQELQPGLSRGLTRLHTFRYPQYKSHWMRKTSLVLRGHRHS